MKSYGIYNEPSELGFNLSDWNYLERNWIIAIPMIRGGGDKGLSWH